MSRLNQFLQGIKVVDLSRHLPGPLASLSMAEMGAEVVKVEPPGGEEMRFIGPPGAEGRSAYFNAVNGNKSGIQLNLKDTGDRQRFLDLIRDADVLLESFRPDVMARLDLPVALLRERNPRLIICSLNGYGSNSPLVNAVGHDLNYLAMNGVLEGTGTEAQAVAPWPPLADCSAGLYGLSTVLAALVERSRTGKGCHIEVALADSVMPLMAFPLADLALTGKGTPRAQSLLNGGAARYRTYQTKDGHNIALGAVEPKFWNSFCVAAGRQEWIERISEPLPQTALQREVAEFFSSLTLNEANELLAGVDCCYNDVLPLDKAIETPHIRARQLVVEGPEGEYQALYPAYVDGEAPLPRKGFTEAKQ
ncbi:MAG: CoA transferase [Ketobacteraceae bacterium]|nr:CoA transferase [Ketobacteraceae bacterium]